MEIENTLAKNITAAGEKAAYDAVCKRLLANKVILAWIMKSCLEEYKTHSIHEIAEKYIEGVHQIAEAAVNPDEETRDSGEQIRGVKNEDSTIQEGTITYDIRFLTIVPGTGETIRLMINVEAQNDFYIKASAMCNLSKGVEERGIACGFEQGLAQGLERGMETGTLNAIRNLIETMKLTAEQAMEALKVPEAEKAKYAGMLKG